MAHMGRPYTTGLGHLVRVSQVGDFSGTKEITLTASRRPNALALPTSQSRRVA
jgi:hypothetical protein|eukprot:COSAG06_NODE_5493_length_3445_cov_3.468397_3_plen_53_part_00